MSDNWIIQNLQNAIALWNEKLREIWSLLTVSPESFRGGGIWNVILEIHDGVKAIGYALLVIFFLLGVMKTCGSMTELKRPEQAVKLFLRFAIAKGMITYGLELMLAILRITQGIIGNIMLSSGLTANEIPSLPDEICRAIEKCSFLDSIPLWIVSILGCVLITVLSYVMILSVYGRFFEIYLYVAMAPIPLSTFGGEPTSMIGREFLKNFAGVCMEGAVIILACVIFSAFTITTPVFEEGQSAVSMAWSYVGQMIFYMLILTGTVKMAGRVVRSMLGIGG